MLSGSTSVRAPHEARTATRLESSGRWRRWILLCFALVGAALSGGTWTWRIYRRTSFSPSSQAFADLPMTLPFFSGLGFFGGLLLGAIVVFLVAELMPLRKEPK